MATAPTPGAARAQAAAQRVMRLTVRGEAVDIPDPTNMPIKEKMAVRAATGMAIESHFAGQASFGEDSLVILWWLGRRSAGERDLSFDEAIEQWPSDLAADDLDFRWVALAGDEAKDVEVDHPEA